MWKDTKIDNAGMILKIEIFQLISFLIFDTVYSGKWVPKFRKNVMLPSSGLKYWVKI